MGGIVLRGDDLYVVDTFNHTLRSVSLKTLEVKTLVGVPGMAGLEDGPSATARLRTPQGLVAAGDALYSVSFDGVLREIALTDFSVKTVLGDASDPRARDGVGPEVRLGLGFAQPAPDPRGALYYLDRSANSVRRIDLSLRSVQTVAGPSEPEASRDGELAAARFVSPAALAATADGARFYVADDTAGCIRIIERADARVRTLAGQCGTPGSSDGTLHQARFNSPRGLALSEQTETLFVADAESATVRAIDLKAGSVRTLAGAAGQHEARDGATAAARLVRPIALALDPGRQRLYVAESVGPGSLTGFPMGRAALRLIDLLSGQTSTLAGGDRAAAPLDGPLSTATFQSPAALALAGGQLFVAEPGLATIRLIRLEDGTITTLAGKIGETGPADGSFAEARFDTPSGLAVSAGEQALYVTDSGTNSIRRIDLNARHVTTWLGDPAVSGGFPSGVQQRFDAATLYFPSAPVIAGGGLAYVSEGAVYLARPQKEITR
jgi:DNA-binding beta-propeller fold protein YncE